jgi:hypothetical protein
VAAAAEDASLVPKAIAAGILAPTSRDEGGIRDWKGVGRAKSFSYRFRTKSTGGRPPTDRCRARRPLRETGVVVPGTKHRVEFSYRLA